MKTFYLLLIILLSAYTLNGQNVNIPDQNFKDFLVNTICADLNNDGFIESSVDSNNDGEIQVSEAQAVFLLEINENCLATSLEGLEAFTNLSEFVCENTIVNMLDLSFINSISEIDISDNSNLTSINLGQLSTVGRHFTCDNNPNLQSIDLLNLTTVGGRFAYRFNATTANTEMNLDFSNLTSIGSYLYITDNDSALPMTIDLSSLVNVNQSIIINDNNIATIDLSNLTYIHGFRFRFNTTITELNLGNVISNDQYITSSDEISINSSDLISVDLSSLQFSVERILIIDNNSLDLNLSSLSNVDGNITLSYNSPIVSLPSLITGNITIAGDIQQIDLSALESGGLYVNTDNDDLNSIDLSNLVDGGFNLNNNQLTELNLPNLTTASDISVQNNMLTNVNMPLLETIDDLILNGNELEDFNLDNVTVTGFISLSSNPLTNLNLTNNTIQLLSASNTEFSSLDLSTTTVESFLISNNPNLFDINIKNGDEMGPVTLMSNITLNNVPNLSYICVDESEFEYINSLGIDNCQINSYCSFVPGGRVFAVAGNNILDNNNDGCDSSDLIYPNLIYEITDGTTEGISISNSDGDYSIPLQEGTYTITPNLINPDYFTINPEVLDVTFPANGSVYNQDFCITPNGVKNDLQAYIIPLSVARPGFDATYKIIYRNVGNTTLSGQIDFTFEDDLMDFISSSPSPTTQMSNVLTWDYETIEPFENRSIILTMNLNPPTDATYPLNGGDILNFDTRINPIMNDETFGDNSMGLKQVVVNSFDPNDITCLEGPKITEEAVGNYVHYKIRFENTGSASAVNVVVKTIIDQSKFDISSFLPLEGSHNFTTVISDGNIVEFIFENIELPFDDANNDGYVVFKIKTLPNLVIGNIFESVAEIYFDFNFPIITNTYTTEIVNERLTIEENNSASIRIFPNPVSQHLTIKTKLKVKRLRIYSVSGQLLSEQTGNSNTLDFSSFSNGVYFIKMNTTKGEIHKYVVKK